MTEQAKAALQAMREWLSDEHELGKAPAKLEIAGEFDLHDLHYYIIKYKKSMLSKQWLLGVCGGYAEEELEHCGHLFSEMEEYDPATAEEKAIAMVEMIREYCMQRAREAQEREEDAAGGDEEQSGTGPFAGFVLLDSCEWDFAQLKADLKQDWDIGVQEEEGESEDSLVWNIGDTLAAVSLMPAPVPNGEAEENAANNYLWPEAVAVTQTHVAHLIVAVLDKNLPPLEIAKLYTKICASCLKQKNAIGLYTAGTVFQPQFYREAAESMQEGELPVLCWVYFGLYQTEEGMNAYTYGLSAFGKDEMEVLSSKAKPAELYDFLINISYYVLESDVVLRDGETIGFSEEQKLPITRSAGVSVDGESLKIGF